MLYKFQLNQTYTRFYGFADLHRSYTEKDTAFWIVDTEEGGRSMVNPNEIVLVASVPYEHGRVGFRGMLSDSPSPRGSWLHWVSIT
ncbi:hypothetical protein EG68_11955 [Paragonimus skrjabini miyazakii]|uniref:Uncharacterized protein n=1 Tax=Paragonimus skrjabini miyazakii TaxID=59628 RepID=A0A8S9YDI5_9TREM|nr:hypothetical protein EG68_11955 [Paragonimus skrjabini miyazakii]